MSPRTSSSSARRIRPPSQRSRTKRPSPTALAAPTLSSSDTFDDDIANENKRRKCCCCCSVPVCIVILILFVIAGGIILWQFLPSSTKQSLKDRLPNIKGGGGDGSTSGVDDAEVDGEGDGGGGGFNIPVGGGGEPPTPNFPFYSLCSDRAKCCNGVSTICDMPVNKVMFASLHNGGSTVEDGFYIAGNHEYSLEDALEAGYRGIGLDIGLCGKNNDELKIIHGGCTWGSRDPLTVFKNIHTWLTENPREVIILPMEIVRKEDDGAGEDGDIGGPSLDAIYEIMFEAGIVEDMYWHDHTQHWPTIMQLIEMDKRLIFFYYNSPDCNDQNCPPSFQEWFRYVIETPFSYEDVDAIRQTDNSCSLARGKQSYMQFFAMNLFVTNPLPSKRASQTINSKDFLETMIQTCETISGLIPNVLFVDFWSVGDVVEVVQTENQRRGERYELEQLEQEEEEDGGRQRHRRQLRRWRSRQLQWNFGWSS